MSADRDRLVGEVVFRWEQRRQDPAALQRAVGEALAGGVRLDDLAGVLGLSGQQLVAAWGSS